MPGGEKITARAAALAPLAQHALDRSGMVACPFGDRWFLAAVQEAVGPAEMQRRWRAMLEGGTRG